MSQHPTGVAQLTHSPAFLESVDAFNQHHWYAAHDSFEELWYETTGQLRDFLQALIQISVAEYHLDNGNVRGSTLLMAEGLNHLGACLSLPTGYDLESLHRLVSARLLALQHTGDVLPHPRPQLSLISGDTPSSVSILIPIIDHQ